MPVMNGEEMLECMFENPDLKDTPTIVISTEGSESRVERLEDKGARFIHKPFSPKILTDGQTLAKANDRKLICHVKLTLEDGQGDLFLFTDDRFSLNPCLSEGG